ncbi:LysR family transcriptional regulator [Lactiplantibacillus mudanjiangensis]|uniref:Transcription regulator [Lactobacillus plantarum JDM1] n=1 Tax=Lactiplantibacillus mudanjiangensis TaxID=1296538 RepID=A0A660E0Q6_9LACO|nr:LysR family transcriptional regulator [Lactiplantibacillus mudanjiangensis]VDG22886.1 transcription regulator [Lactobacillus plantarum JDM1] [Lactiplantibacillus mudanjiangensis]VDG29254.1 transcription regulator [Lactobacillus plantarum JDM1] [Lactiplantibacillus mudanjiangensis]VDG31780.1 transcription regulator [Lactobacillus plantarum JDM1] [Lactiplantibacillus mudanjiangensis]
MNLDHLRYFVALSRTENYTQTAKLLHITQPSLTKAIHSLENELNLPLFKRIGRNVELTPAGKLFANGVESSLITLDKSIADIKSFNQQKAVIRVASLRTLSIKWLPDMAQRFLQATQNSAIRFQFNTDTGLSPDILNGLRTKQYDVAFCSKLDNYSDLDFFPVAEQTMVCITPTDHALANRSSINLTETLAYPQITFSERSGLHPIMTKLFNDCGGQPISAYSVEEDQAIAGLVANGFGIAVVPNMSILQTMPVKIIPLSFPNWQRILYMAALKTATPQPAVNQFITFVRTQSKQLSVNNI